MKVFEDLEVSRVVFHYNKAHNQDQTIPPWVVKHRGNTWYVHHLDSKVGFSTKETPDNSNTKASLLLRGTLQITEDAGVITATVSPCHACTDGNCGVES